MMTEKDGSGGGWGPPQIWFASFTVALTVYQSSEEATKAKDGIRHSVSASVLRRRPGPVSGFGHRLTTTTIVYWPILRPTRSPSYSTNIDTHSATEFPVPTLCQQEETGMEMEMEMNRNRSKTDLVLDTDG